MSDEIVFQTKLRDKLLDDVPRMIKGVKVNGHLSQRLPNNAHFSFERLQSESLLLSLDMSNIAASMGSACASGAMEPSHVLRAIGLSDELSYGALRVTLGRWNTEEQVDYLLEKLPALVTSLRI
jgi:cysteine desulfurase